MTDYNVIVVMSQDAATHFEPKSIAVRELLELKGWKIELEVEPTWTGFVAKVRWLQRCARELTQYTHLALLDARDIVMLGTPDEVMERYFEFNHPWVFNAEPFIWPANAGEPEDFPECEGPYRYPNAGAHIGEREHILKHLDGQLLGEEREDGLYYTRMYLGTPGSILLDHQCKLFQCMCGSLVGPEPHCTMTPGHVHNNTTGTDPLIIHFNGGDDITQPHRRILWDCLID